MTDAEFLKSEAENEIFTALHCDCGECHEDARVAVKAWAKAAGIKTAEAWLTIIREDRAYAQEVIDDVRAERAEKSDVGELTLKITADFSEYEAALKAHFADLAGLSNVFVWNVGESPDLSELTGNELETLHGAVVRENRDREDYALNAAHKASGEAYTQTLNECRAMTGAELEQAVLA